MRSLIAAAAFGLLPLSAMAQEGGYVDSGYVEGSVGLIFAPTVNTKTYTFVVPPDTATGRGELNYSNALIAGAEAGWTGFWGGNWRTGFSYDYMRLKLDSLTVVGQVDGAPGSIKFDSSLVRSAGFNFDNSVQAVMYNFYYNLSGCQNVCAYLGGGAGAAMIEHANPQFALSATAGVRLNLTPSSYLGLRYRFYRVAGPTDNLGVQYEPITSHTVSALIGFYFR